MSTKKDLTHENESKKAAIAAEYDGQQKMYRGAEASRRGNIISIRSNGRRRVQAFASGESRTKQQFKDECDINTILQRYERQGIDPAVLQANPQYLDLTDSQTFEEAATIVANAKSLFEELPTAVKVKFNNSPKAFLEFAEDPKNGEQMVEWGLGEKIEPIAKSKTEEHLEHIANNTKPKARKSAQDDNSDA